MRKVVSVWVVPEIPDTFWGNSIKYPFNKYCRGILIVTNLFLSLSICVTVMVLNVHFRSPQTHRMAPWVKLVFIQILPKVLFMRRPKYTFDTKFRKRQAKEPQLCFYPYYSSSNLDRVSSQDNLSASTLLAASNPFGCQIHGPPTSDADTDEVDCGELSHTEPDISGSGRKSPILTNPGYSHAYCPPEMHMSCFYVRFIAEHTKLLEDSTKVSRIYLEDMAYTRLANH